MTNLRTDFETIAAKLEIGEVHGEMISCRCPQSNADRPADLEARTKETAGGPLPEKAWQSHLTWCPDPCSRRNNIIVSRFCVADVEITAVADHKSKQDNRDRSQVAAGEDYEVQYFAEETGITPQQARALIREHGNDHEKLMEEAKAMRSG